MNLRRMVAAGVLLVASVAVLGSVTFAGSAPTRIHASQVRIVDHIPRTAAITSSWSIGSRAPILGRMIPARVSRAAGIGRAAIKIPVVSSLPVLDPSQNPNFDPTLVKGLDSYISETSYPYLPLLSSVEPPDPALCVGGGQVIEMVELAIEIFDTSGALVSGPTDLYSFFGSQNITGKKGGQDSIGLARCYYDTPTNTFFFVATDVGNQQGRPPASALLLAVMPAGNTSPVSFVIVSTTDNGPAPTIKHRHCPCYEDQPLIGADANGVYISGNEFSLNSAAFNGGQIYAFNKADLVAGTPNPGAVLFEAPNNLFDTPKDKDAAASIVPAAATDGVFETANNGTEYFLSAVDFAHTRDNRIALWAIINTCGIPDSTGAVACTGFAPMLTSMILPSNAYGVPPDARQQKGLTPVGQLCQNNRVSKLSTFDDRMQQVTFANGKLYSAVTTVLTVNKQKHAGLLDFVVNPSIVSGVLNGTITDSQYVASDGLDLFYPAIAATQSGSAVMTFSFSGRNMFPSAGYIPLTSDLGMFEIHTAITGAGAYDGESGYPGCGGFTSALWGFNSSAVAENDKLWMATEYVSATCDSKTWREDHTCTKTRGVGSNWGTLVSKLVPPGGP
jgi:hypothetical protein